MAVTATNIIGRALRILGVLDAGEAIKAEDAQDALETLNALLAEWHEANIGLPDYQIDSVTDTLASDVADREAIAYELALRIAPEYGATLSQEAALAGRQSMFRLRSRYLAVSHPVPVDYY